MLATVNLHGTMEPPLQSSPLLSSPRVLLIGAAASALCILTPRPNAWGSLPRPAAQNGLSGPEECHTNGSDWFVRELASVNISEKRRGNTVTFNALNSAGKSIGKITITVSRDTISIAAQFSDGNMKLVVDPGAQTPTVKVRGLNATIMEQRLAAVSDILPSGTTTQAGWLKCSLTIAATVAACLAAETGAGAVGCVAGAGAAACECLPLVSEEFEDIEC